MDSYGILAKQAATTGWVDLYTCPVTAEKTFETGNISVRPLVVTRRAATLVSSIVVCRLAGTGVTAEWVSLAVVDAPAGAVGNSNYIVYQMDIPGGTTKVFGLSMTLSASQTLRVISQANASINVIVNGVEIL